MTHDHNVERDHDQALDPVRLRICSDVVHQEARPEEQRHLEEVCICPVSTLRCATAREMVAGDPPKSRCMGLVDHQPRSTRKGIHHRVNWMLRSIARPRASMEGV